MRDPVREKRAAVIVSAIIMQRRQAHVVNSMRLLGTLLTMKAPKTDFKGRRVG